MNGPSAELIKGGVLEQSGAPSPFLLIVSCSATKRQQPGPALQVYDGPAYRILRPWVASQGVEPRCLVLSAMHGFIGLQEPIAPYEQRMDDRRAAEIADDPVQAERLLDVILKPVVAAEVFVFGGKVYRTAIQSVLARLGDRVPKECRLSFSQGGIGVQLGQLKRWCLDHSLP